MVSHLLAKCWPMIYLRYNIVNHVSKQYKETAFPSVNYNMNDSNQQQLLMMASSRQSGALNQSTND
jgi:hypothetical protein